MQLLSVGALELDHLLSAAGTAQQDPLLWLFDAPNMMGLSDCGPLLSEIVTCQSSCPAQLWWNFLAADRVSSSPSTVVRSRILRFFD